MNQDLIRKLTGCADGYEMAPVLVDVVVAAAVQLGVATQAASGRRSDQPSPSLCRIQAIDPSPRLLRQLALLRFVPMDPVSDELWFVDEPFTLSEFADATIVDVAAEAYAAAMSSLFPGERFEGRAATNPFVGARVGASRAEIRRMAERRFVVEEFILHGLTATWLQGAVDAELDRIGEASARAGLERPRTPTLPTICRWLAEFRAKHRRDDRTNPADRSG